MNKKTLKEQFEAYRPPVDEAGWARLDRAPALRRNRRARKLRKFLPLGTACATIAAVAVALCIALPRHERDTTTVAGNAQPAAQTTPATSAASDYAAAATAAPTLPYHEATATVHKNGVAAPAVPTATSPAQSAVENSRPAPNVPGSGNSTKHVNIKPLSPVIRKPVPPLTPLPPLRLAELQPKATGSGAQETEPDTIMPEPRPAAEPARLFLAPNAFTPNNDGINDLFLLQCNEHCTFFELDIYTRTGENVFNAKHIDQGWNGKRLDNGEPMPQAVYVYTVKYRTAEGKSGTEHGQILLIR